MQDLRLSDPKPVKLASDPNAALSVSYLEGSKDAPIIVFLNGLARPAAAFKTCVEQFLALLTGNTAPLPSVLLYDRYGQGSSEKQTSTHTATQVAATLNELLVELGGKSSPLILVGNSIGCAVARLYAAKYPNVKAMLLLDPMIAHTDFVSLFEARDSDKVNAEEQQQLERAKAIFGKIFHPSLPNAEGFDRSRLKDELPSATEPPLLDQPFITVVGHDPQTFALDTEQKMGVPTHITLKYLDLVWSQYNKDLTTLTSTGRRKGPIIAVKADHFIQVTRPDLVAEELEEMYLEVLKDVA